MVLALVLRVFKRFRINIVDIDLGVWDILNIIRSVCMCVWLILSIIRVILSNIRMYQNVLDELIVDYFHIYFFYGLRRPPGL